ncbi:MAG: PEP-CTERM-box response regulator transcription factor [Nitrospirota bacterium]|jgi:two-component system NtrC family response regulator
MEKLLIVDDSEEIRKQLKWGLGKDYAMLLAGDVEEGLSLFRKHRPKVVTLDLGLPPREEVAEEGMRCLREILLLSPPTKVVVVTGNDERENALQAIQMGAYDYYQKPIDLKELTVIIGRAFHLCKIEEENRKLHQALEKKASELGDMIGQCSQMASVFSTIRKVSTSDASVLVMGESGTGKELAAKAVHSLSLRSNGPFVPINCGAIPEHLLESELFGHEKGAFTGAHNQVQGKVEYAHKGTLFLDEIGELQGNLQVKLLRFLEEKAIQRVGGRDSIPVDTRIVAATNIDMWKAIEDGRFREDLYYRLGVITLKLPPLRARGQDIMLLANLFLRRFCREYHKKALRFSESSVRALQSYGWPGNVRELENKIQRAVLMSDSPAIEIHDLALAETPRVQKEPDNYGPTLREARDKVEREMIISAIKRHGHNMTRAADELGVSRPTLYDLARKHGFQDLGS